MIISSRPILVDDLGIVLSKAEVAKGRSLCDFCSIKTRCEIRTSRILIRCDHYVPALGFSTKASIGLEGKFSSFRTSKIWFARINALEKTDGAIGLWNQGTEELISIARAERAVVGPFSDLIEEHAHTNHMVQAMAIPKEQAATWLTRKMIEFAGPRYIKSPSQTCTVIYVENIREGTAQAAPQADGSQER